jgi:hypothetical protein
MDLSRDRDYLDSLFHHDGRHRSMARRNLIHRIADQMGVSWEEAALALEAWEDVRTSEGQTVH